MGVREPWKSHNDVYIQDQTSNLVQYYLMHYINSTITLTSTLAKDSMTVNVSAGHGFGSAVSGERIVIWENSIYMQAKVRTVVNNTLTIDVPSANNFTTSATVVRGNINMNVDGSSTPVDFHFIPTQSVLPIDISFVKINMLHTAEGDLGKFGGITALTNGVYFRHENGSRANLGNYVSNQDFDSFGAEVSFPDKAPAGTYATKIWFDLKSIFGNVIRVNPRIDDCICGVVRDKIDSSTGLTSFRTSLLGSYTEGE